LTNRGEHAALHYPDSTSILDLLSGKVILEIPSTGKIIFSDDDTTMILLPDGKGVQIWDILNRQKQYELDITSELYAYDSDSSNMKILLEWNSAVMSVSGDCVVAYARSRFYHGSDYMDYEADQWENTHYIYWIKIRA